MIISSTLNRQDSESPGCFVEKAQPDEHFGKSTTYLYYWDESGKDPGGKEDPVINIYAWHADTKLFAKKEVHRGKAGIGLQIRIADMNGDGKKDIVVPGKSGTHVLFNES